MIVLHKIYINNKSAKFNGFGLTFEFIFLISVIYMVLNPIDIDFPEGYTHELRFSRLFSIGCAYISNISQTHFLAG